MSWKIWMNKFLFLFANSFFALEAVADGKLIPTLRKLPPAHSLGQRFPTFFTGGTLFEKKIRALKDNILSKFEKNISCSKYFFHVT